MGQTLSFDDTDHAGLAPNVGVPMLDWPSDLFTDDANLADLVTVDFLHQCDPAFLPRPQESRELCMQLAA
jgi:hypothetical protein